MFPLNLNSPNPFTPNYSQSQDKNYLVLNNPINRAKAGVSHLDNSFLISSQYFQSAKNTPIIQSAERSIQKAL